MGPLAFALVNNPPCTTNYPSVSNTVYEDGGGHENNVFPLCVGQEQENTSQGVGVELMIVTPSYLLLYLTKYEMCQPVSRNYHHEHCMFMVIGNYLAQVQILPKLTIGSHHDGAWVCWAQLAVNCGLIRG